ncbi:hypothetical protein AV926_13705 [Myroides marinus]|uniref:Leucine rich repeat-containing protein n=1 Tax=Myroides marinus TaxID=703342 RepID=A0A163XLS3_9FLAO|nr:hypothetical protein [Myroides marinus]KZE78091.1 hypothetical protein AV926_13705 [Myroides marinus]
MKQLRILFFTFSILVTTCIFGSKNEVNVSIQNSRKLDLSNKNLVELPNNLSSNIEELDLSHNKISYIDAKKLPTNLKKLNLSYNSFTSLDNIKELIDLNLVELNLSNNSIKNESMPGELTFLFRSKIQKINLSYNKFSGSIFINYSKSDNTSALKDLDLSNNKLNSVTIHRPLEKLRVNNNNLLGIYLDSSLLIFLDISNNKELSSELGIKKPKHKINIVRHNIKDNKELQYTSATLSTIIN